jgi:hypothetical protein
MSLRGTLTFLVLVHGLPPIGGSHALAQGFNLRYDVLGQSLAQVGYSIEQSGGNCLVIGSTALITSDSFYYSPIVFSLLLDPLGEVLTSDTFFIVGHATAPGTYNCLAPRANGGFVLGGGTLDQSENYHHALWLLDSNGSITLVSEYGSDGIFNTSRQAIECKNGDFLLVGETDSAGTPDASLIRTDTTGAVLWSRTYGGDLQDRAYFVDTTADNGFFMSGQYGYTNGGPYGRKWVVRVDAEGDTLWQRIWGGEFGHDGARLTTKANGNALISGATRLGEGEERLCYMAELDASDGDLIWERHYGNLGFDMNLLIAKEVEPGRGHVACGMVIDNQQGHDRGVMLRTADNGDSLWMRTFQYYDTLITNGKGFLYDIVPTLDDGFIACGPAYGIPGAPYPPGYSQDLWVVKVDSLGCIEPGCNIPMGITTQITNLRGALLVHPNPVSHGGPATVRVDLPDGLRKEPLRLSVVSADGRLVEEMSVAPHASQVVLHTSDFRTGLYHLHLTSGNTWISGTKLVVE